MSAEQKLPSDQEVRGGVQGSLKYWVGKLECGGDVEKQWFYKQKFIKRLRESEIAIETEKANEQHYEVPTEYFTTVLGKWRKYSCCYWPEGVNDLEQAEEAMMKMYAERAKLEDGHAVMASVFTDMFEQQFVKRSNSNSCAKSISPGIGDPVMILKIANQHSAQNI